jgi:hypothetical protein
MGAMTWLYNAGATKTTITLNMCYFDVKASGYYQYVTIDVPASTAFGTIGWAPNTASPALFTGPDYMPRRAAKVQTDSQGKLIYCKPYFLDGAVPTPTH